MMERLKCFIGCEFNSYIHYSFKLIQPSSQLIKVVRDLSWLLSKLGKDQSLKKKDLSASLWRHEVSFSGYVLFQTNFRGLETTCHSPYSNTH